MDFYILTNNTENTESIKATLCCDICGNVYLVFDNNYFLASVDRNNDLEFYKVYQDKFEELNNIDELEYEKIIDTQNSTLKQKALENIENEDDSDQEEDFINYKEKMKYLKEEKYYLTEKDLDFDKKPDEYDELFKEEKFNFYKRQNNNDILLLNKGIDSFAIYDTYIRNINGDVLSSIIFNNNNSYRISFYKELNIAELNIIGCEIKKYKLYYYYDENKEICISSKIHNN